MQRADKLRELLARGDWDRVASLLGNLDVQVAGDMLLSLPPERQQSLFRSLPVETAARIASALPYYDAYVLLHSRPLEQMRAIVDRMEIGERLRFFDELPEEAWQRLTDELGEAQPGGARAAEILSAPADLPPIPPVIEARQIEKSYSSPGGGQVQVIAPTNLSIEPGLIIAMLGPSGSGKSTLLRMLSGLAPPTKGEVLWHGEPLRNSSPNVAIVFQSFALFPWLTVVENVEVPLLARGMARRERRRRASRALDSVGLKGFASAYPKELSGGMKQRVGLARALAVEPEVLFMDEPFSALDVLTAENLRGELMELWLAKKMPIASIFLVTHNIEEAVLLADRILVLGRNPAKIRADFRIQAKHPRDHKSAEFLLYVDYIYKLLTQPSLEARPPSIAAGAKPPLPDAAARAPGSHRRITRVAERPRRQGRSVPRGRGTPHGGGRSAADCGGRHAAVVREVGPGRCRNHAGRQSVCRGRHSQPEASVPRSRARQRHALAANAQRPGQQVGPHDAARVLPRPAAAAFFRERDRAADRDRLELGALWRNPHLFPRGRPDHPVRRLDPRGIRRGGVLKQRHGAALSGGPPWSALSATVPSLWKDLPILCAGLALFWALLSLTRYWTGPVNTQPDIDLSPAALPKYALFSVARILIAYTISLAVTVIYAYTAAHNAKAERVMIPLLDTLQSIPVLSFLPPVMVAMVGLFPTRQLGVELGAILLIFTGQVWNMTFSVYSSIKNIPRELLEATEVYRLSWWQKLIQLELPYAAIGLIWNSMMSVAGGWFFLMACEMFVLGNRDLRLPGLGSYLQTAANAGDTRAILWGVAAMIAVIVLMDQLIWRPVIAWGEKFKFEQVEAIQTPRSPVLDLLRHSKLLSLAGRVSVAPVREALTLHFAKARASGRVRVPSKVAKWIGRALAAAGVVAIAYAVARMVVSLGEISRSGLRDILVGAGATFLRVELVLLLAGLWTIPVGVFIGLRPRLAAIAQPIAQVAASVPATALFPIVLLGLIRLGGGLGIGSIVLLLLGTQWYLLFNIIAGASAIPTDLKEVCDVYRLKGAGRWRKLLLPGIFPFLITGFVTASGGAWNASIVAEYFRFHGQTFSTTGLGAVISRAADRGDFAVLLGATITMAVMVVTVNRLVWRRLYALASTRFKLEG